MKKNYLNLFIILVALLFLTSFFIEWQIIAVFTLIFTLFFLVNLKRNNLKLETFEITPSNKNPKVPMSWYRDEIISHMYVLRWPLTQDLPEKKEWRPRGMTRVMEESFSMTYTPFMITISGSRNMITTLKSILDLEKIFL